MGNRKVDPQGQTDYPIALHPTPDVERLTTLYDAMRAILLAYRLTLAEAFPESRVLKKWGAGE